MNEKYKIIDDKYFVLNVKDDYEHLNEKTLSMIQTINLLFQSIKGMFKCHDDIIVNIEHIQNMLNTIPNENINYCGKSILRTKEYNNYAKKKVLINIQHMIVLIAVDLYTF